MLPVCSRPRPPTAFWWRAWLALLLLALSAGATATGAATATTTNNTGATAAAPAPTSAPASAPAGTATAASASAATSSGYRLFARDKIRIAVHGENDLCVERRIDGNGCVSLPLLASLRVQGLTVAEAEERIAQAYIREEILVHPHVALSVVEYFSRVVSVLGQVNKPGKVELPIEAPSLSIVEAISNAGGLTRIARADSVRVTRRPAAGGEQIVTVDVERMIDGRGGVAVFLVEPGDIVFVPERVF